MDNFFTWEMLATFAGCMTGTIILTEFVKKMWKDAPAQIISFVFAFIILMVGQIVTGKFTWNDILLDTVNAVAVSLSANGGFDAVKSLFVKEDKKPDEPAEDIPTGVVVLDPNDPAASYIQLPEDPVDGEQIKVTVKIV